MVHITPFIRVNNALKLSHTTDTIIYSIHDRVVPIIIIFILV